VLILLILLEEQLKEFQIYFVFMFLLNLHFCLPSFDLLFPSFDPPFPPSFSASLAKAAKPTGFFSASSLASLPSSLFFLEFFLSPSETFGSTDVLVAGRSPSCFCLLASDFFSFSSSLL
jgi:hypothetical protein